MSEREEGTTAITLTLTQPDGTQARVSMGVDSETLELLVAAVHDKRVFFAPLAKFNGATEALTFKEFIMRMQDALLRGETVEVNA